MVQKKWSVDINFPSFSAVKVLHESLDSQMNLRVRTAIDDDDRLNEAKKESFVLRQIPPP